MNYFSGVKTLFQCAGLDKAVFESYYVKTTKRAHPADITYARSALTVN